MTPPTPESPRPGWPEVVFTRDLERLVRSLVAQKTDATYIRHYLIETYQVDNALVDQLFAKLGVKSPTKPGQKGGNEGGDRRSRQGF